MYIPYIYVYIRICVCRSVANYLLAAHLFKPSTLRAMAPEKCCDVAFAGYFQSDMRGVWNKPINFGSGKIAGSRNAGRTILVRFSHGARTNVSSHYGHPT